LGLELSLDLGLRLRSAREFEDLYHIARRGDRPWIGVDVTIVHCMVCYFLETLTAEKNICQSNWWFARAMQRCVPSPKIGVSSLSGA
jgi:hypothetical protein